MADVQDLVDTWIEIGKKNHWIARAQDPPFTRESFRECHSVAELKERVGHGNWCLGQAFHLGHLCLINQIDGGDEWLAVGTGDVGAFDSVTFGPSIREGRFEPLVEKLLAAARGSTTGYEYDVARQVEDGVRCAVCEEVFAPGDRVGFSPRPAMRAHPWDAEAGRCVVEPTCRTPSTQEGAFGDG